MEKFSIAVVLPNSDVYSTEVSSAMKTVKDLKEKLSQEFEINKRFLLVIDDCVLPANENIRILKHSDTVKVITGIADYYPFMGTRIKLDLSFFYPDVRKFGYVWISSEIKTFENFKKHILEMCSIPTPIRLLRNGGNFSSLNILKDEDVITVLPDYSLSIS